MKLGIFDSGMGGLLIARSILEQLPDINLTYLGDTLHLPYGARSKDAIYQYTKNAIEFLFEQDCALIIVACNTASAAALRQIQQEYLPQSYPDRRVLGVVVPTLEAASEKKFKRVGLIATKYIVESGIYSEELKKINPEIEIFSKATPLLVPLIENEGEEWLHSVLESYLLPLKEQNIDSLILGCTHYAFIKDMAQMILGPEVAVLSQTDIIPQKAVDYLERHPEINTQISYDGEQDYFLSDITSTYLEASKKMCVRDVVFQKVGTLK